MKKILYILLLLFIFSCKHEVEINEAVVASVGDKNLYAEDIGLSSENNINDSSLVYKQIVNNWILKQLEYQKAVKNIGDNNLEIDRLVEEYKIFLYIDKYKKEYIEKKLDTVITKIDLLDFYEKNKSLYILKNNIVKANYIKVPLKSPKLYKLTQWLRSDKIEDQEQLSSYCVQYADKYDDFDNNWMKFDDIINNIPKNISNQESVLKYSKRIEVRDSTYYYLVYINNYKLVNDTSPVFYIQEEVSKGILKQRKKDLLIALKNNILREGKSMNIIKSSYLK
jgi:hypothetical protein